MTPPVVVRPSLATDTVTSNSPNGRPIASTIPGMNNFVYPTLGAEGDSQHLPQLGINVHPERKVGEENKSFMAGDKAEEYRDLMAQNARLADQLAEATRIMTLGRQPQRCIPPETFSVESGYSFDEFLFGFEDYCTQTYPGSLTRMGMLLGKYLQGSIASVYKVIRITESDYNNIKRQLLIWVASTKRNDTSQHYREFESIQLAESEEISVFALRLTTLANRCFPGGNSGNLYIVRQKFMESMPGSIQEDLKKTIATQECLMGITIAWNSLVALAEQLYRASRPSTDQPPVRPDPEVVDLSPLEPRGESFRSDQYFGVPSTSTNLPPWPIPQIRSQKIPVMSPHHTYPEPTLYVPSMYQPMHLGDAYSATCIPTARSMDLRSSEPINMIYNHAGASGRVAPQQAGGTTAQHTAGKSNFNLPSAFAKPLGGPRPQSRAVGHPMPLGGPNSTQNNNKCRGCERVGHLFGQCPERPLCYFCSKRGHTLQQCYRYLGVCCWCQGNHASQECPTKYPSGPPAEMEVPSPSCPFCQADHWGINCPTWKSGN